MATNCLVGGSVRCGTRPATGVSVDVVLLDDNKRGTAHRATATTDAAGAWAVSFDVGLDVAALPFAKIVVDCSPPPARIYLARLESSLAGTASQALRSMIANIGTEIISRVIGAPILTPILSTDFVYLVANGGVAECCPPVPSAGGTGTVAGGGAAGTGTGSGGTGGGSGTGTGESVGSGTSGSAAEDAARRAEASARRAEAAAARAERERERAEEERRRAEEERRRAAEAALAEARRLNRRRTRLCFDLKGTASTPGKAGISVGGRTSVVDVASGDSAEEVLGRLADSLRFRGYEIDGPKRDPGTGEFVICVLSDAAGEDPRGGIIGSIDIRGFQRTSVHRETYRPDLVRGREEPAAMRAELGSVEQLAMLSTVELAFRTDTGDGLETLRVDVMELETADHLAERIALATDGLVAGVALGEGGAMTLEVSTFLGSGKSLEALALEVFEDAAGVTAGRSEARLDFGGDTAEG